MQSVCKEKRPKYIAPDYKDVLFRQLLVYVCANHQGVLKIYVEPLWRSQTAPYNSVMSPESLINAVAGIQVQRRLASLNGKVWQQTANSHGLPKGTARFLPPYTAAVV